MKTVRKLLALILTLTVALTMGVSMTGAVFAAQTYSITIDNAVNGETYTAYKIFDVTYSGDNSSPGTAPDAPNPDNTHMRTAYAYSISSSSEWWGTVTNNASATADTFTANGLKFTKTTTAGVYNVEATNDFNAATFAALLDANKSGKTSAGSATGASGTATINVSPDKPGYYFIDTTMGSLCSLDTTEPSATIREKNTIPTIDKTEKTSGDSYVDGPVDANIGDTVHYQVVITDGTGTDKIITMTDTMSAGLDYTAGSIKINGTAVADDASNDNWTVTVNGRVITIVFSAAYVAGLDAGDTITVTYDATINKDAVVDDDDANENKAELAYSQQHSEDKVYVETYDFQLFKTDGKEFLEGAGFKLYDDATGGNLIKVGKDTTGYYVDANSDEEILVDSANGVNVRGLAPGTYYLEETTVPNGYKKLAERASVTITTGATAAVEITVVNETGAELPSTGGIGTTIFYILGALLVIVCGIVLVARRRMAAK